MTPGTHLRLCKRITVMGDGCQITYKLDAGTQIDALVVRGPINDKDDLIKALRQILFDLGGLPSGDDARDKAISILKNSVTIGGEHYQSLCVDKALRGLLGMDAYTAWVAERAATDLA